MYLVASVIIFSSSEDLSDSEALKKYYNPNELVHEVISELVSKYSDWCKIFTDGSKSVNGCGAAFFCQNTGYKASFKIDAPVCIMSVELIAIYQAVA